MSETFNDPFSYTAGDPCDNNTCPPCVETPSIESCFICGYPHEAFEDCQNSHATPCLGGSVECLDCESSFPTVTFLGGHIVGFSSKLGFGPSESSVTIDLVVMKHSCSVAPSGCQTPIPCNDDIYTGQLGYIYTFNVGGFCFRGILSNHNYTEDSSGYRYKVTLSDGRTVLSGCSVLLNGIYDPVPDKLQPNLINLLRDIEPSIYDDQCALLQKCNTFMQSGANKQGIYLYKAIEKLHGKCISLPISGASLTLNLQNLIGRINTSARTTNSESTVLELIDLACEESGLGFFAKINNNNEIEFIPINYKINPDNLNLFTFIENLNNQDLVISKDYGQEMTLEKGKKILFGAEYCYMASVVDTPKYDLNVLMPDDCTIQNAPWQQPNVRTIHGDGPIESDPIQLSNCFPYN